MRAWLMPLLVMIGLPSCVLNVDTVDVTNESEMEDSTPTWRSLSVSQCDAILFIIPDEFDPDHIDRCPRDPSLILRGKPGNAVHGTLHMQGYGAAAERAARDAKIGFELQSDLVVAQPSGTESSPFGETVEVDRVAIDMPSARNAQVIWPRGSVDIADIDGDVALGPAVLSSESHDTISGRIRIGGDANIERLAHVGALDVEANNVTVDVADGHLRIAATGTARITAAAAGVELSAESAQVHADGGIKGSVRGSAQVMSAGPVALRVAGGGAITTSGDAPIEVVVIGSDFDLLELESVRGDIRIVVPVGLDFALELDARGGVKVDTGDTHEHGTSFHGELGASGPRITARSARGTITVIERDP